MKRANVLVFIMLIHSFGNKTAGFVKAGILAVVIFANTSCGSEGPGNDDPEPEMVHSIKGEITGMTINVADSTISIRMGGFVTPVEVLLSAKKNANGGKVNLEAPLLAEENIIPWVGRYGLTMVGFKDLDKPLTVSSAEEDKKYIGYGTNNNDKIDVLAAERYRGTLGYAGVDAYPKGSEDVTLEEIVGIITKPLKLIGEEATGIGGTTSAGDKKTFKMAIN